VANKNDEEKLLNLEQKIKQLEAQKKGLLIRVRDKERKERTRNLIEMGAILQSVNLELFISKYDVELLKKFFIETKEGQQLLNEFDKYRQEQLKAECEEMAKEASRIK
jgi:hypothetical protein